MEFFRQDMKDYLSNEKYLQTTGIFSFFWATFWLVLGAKKNFHVRKSGIDSNNSVSAYSNITIYILL